MNDLIYVVEKPSTLTHPYEAELTALMEDPQLQFAKIAMDDFDMKMGDSYVWVESELQLSQLARVLSEQTVFAVDTEQHSLRSFLGFTALIQVNQ